MVLGIVLIFCGMMIAMFPPLLSIIVATLLVIMGSFLIAISYRYKKMSKRYDDPFLDFFMKM